MPRRPLTTVTDRADRSLWSRDETQVWVAVSRRELEKLAVGRVPPALQLTAQDTLERWALNRTPTPTPTTGEKE